MIIQNGTIEFISISGGGGLDSNGYPVKPSEVRGEPVPCQYYPNTHDNLGKSNGEAFIRASYTILVEFAPLDATERLLLRDADGNEVREFSVISVEPLVAVCQTRILV